MVAFARHRAAMHVAKPTHISQLQHLVGMDISNVLISAFAFTVAHFLSKASGDMAFLTCETNLAK